MTHNISILGVDVSKDTLFVAFYDADTKETQQLPTVSNDKKGWRRLASLCRRLTPTAVCLEPTSIYHLGVTAALQKAGQRVALLHTKAVKDYASCLGARNKTDRLDAGILALFGAHQQGLDKLREYQPPTPQRQALRDGVKLLNALKQEVLAGHNRLETIQDKEMKRRQQRVLKGLLKEQEKLEKDLVKIAHTAADCRQQMKRLETIPGIGSLTAVILLAENADAAPSVRALAAMHAIAPQQRQSGTSLRHSRLSPCGRRLLRRSLYFPTLSAIRHNPLVRDFHARLAQRGIKGKSLVCACLHKLLRIAFGVLKNQKPFNPHILSSNTSNI